MSLTRAVCPGGVCLRECLPRGVSTQDGVSLWGCTPPGPRGKHPVGLRGRYFPDPEQAPLPPEITTEAGGKHPSGMYSCLTDLSKGVKNCDI